MKYLSQELLIGIWILVMITGTTAVFWGITHESIWYDESYTAAMTNHSLLDILRFSSGDVHPPLYYLMARLFRLIFGNSTLALRALSVLGLLALVGLGIGPVRRIFDVQGGLLFTVLVFIHPFCLSVAQDARMYTWACYFVTAGVLYGYLAVTKEALRDWILFGLFTILANYTHVYALLEMVLLHSVLLLWALLRKRNILKPLLLTSGVVSIVYSPWLAALAGQATHVTKDFWIPAPNAASIWQTLTCPFGDKFSMTANPLFMLISFIAVIVLFSKSLHNAFRQKTREGSMIWLAFGILGLTFFASLIISWLVHPIFLHRYFFTVLGLYVLVLMYGIQSLRPRFLIPVICVMFLGLSLPTFLHIYNNRVNGPMFEVVEQLGPQVQPGDVFVHGDEHTFGTFIYYFPEHQHYLYLPEGFEGYSSYDLYGPNGVYGHDFGDFLTGQQTVWLVNRLGLFGVKFEELSVGDILKTGPFSIATRKLVFWVLPGWYRVSVIRFTRNSDVI